MPIITTVKRMSQLIFDAPAELQRDVKCFWVLDEAQEVYNCNPIVPDSYRELVINCGAPIIREGESHELPRVYLSELQTRPRYLYASGVSHVIAVRLYPWAVPSLLNVEASQDIVVLDQRWQDFGNMIALTAERKGYVEAIAQLQQFVCDHYRNTSRDAATMQAVGQMIYRKRGRLDTSDPEARGFFSLSRFERLFKQYTGVTPKLYARLVRFESICDALAENPSRSLTELAFSSGYTDQSHFIHDFKALAGRTPGNMATYTRAYLQRWQRADFLQLR